MRIHRITARETNCYLLWGRRGVILIDPGPPGRAATIMAGAKEAGVRAEDVRLILNLVEPHQYAHPHKEHGGDFAQNQLGDETGEQPAAQHAQGGHCCQGQRRAEKHQRGILCLAVMLMTASCVLSPSSATNSRAKVLSRTRTSSGIGVS